MDLDALKAKLAATPALRAQGRVLGVTGLALRFALPGVRVGDVVVVKRRGGPLPCEVVGFSEGEAIAMPLGALAGVGLDDEVEATGGGFTVRASEALLGRVVDAAMKPVDGLGPIKLQGRVALHAPPPPAMTRRRISRPLQLGIRSIDAFLTCGEG